MRTVIVNIYGKVQGVGFRHFVVKTAKVHGLNGSVKNEPDGSVTIQVTGLRQELDVFLKAIEVGNGFSRVDCMSLEDKPAVIFKEFKVVY